MAKKYSLINIRKSHYEDIKRITSQKKTMSNVGPGHIWSDKKIQNFIKYNLIEQKESPKTRANFYWAMKVTYPPINTKRTEIIGIVGIHRVSYDKSKKFYVTIFVDQNHTGNGYGSLFLSGAITKFRKLKPNTPIYADIGTANIASQKIHKRAGFKSIRTRKINGKPYIQLRLSAEGT